MLWIHSIGHFHPENEITNRFLEELGIGTTEAWILEHVGIRSRRTVLPLSYIRSTYNQNLREAAAAALYSNAETGCRAALQAIARAGLSASDIGLVIAGGCAPDTTTPAEASSIAGAVGIEAPCFDIGAACSTFVAQLHALRSMQPDALPDFVLLVVVENTTRVVDYRDRRTAVLWGDGSAAAVVSARHPGPVAVLHTSLYSKPQGADKVRIPRYGHFAQDGPAVQKFAIRHSVAALRDLQQRFAHVPPSRFHFIGHQANRVMLDAICRAAGIAPERHHHNVCEFGNTGAAGGPTVLSQRWHQFQPGDHVALVSVGSGLTWGSAMLRFEEPAADGQPRGVRPARGGSESLQAGEPAESASSPVRLVPAGGTGGPPAAPRVPAECRSGGRKAHWSLRYSAWGFE